MRFLRRLWRLITDVEPDAGARFVELCERPPVPGGWIL